MVTSRLTPIEQVKELIAHGSHAIDVDLVEQLLQIIEAYENEPQEGTVSWVA